MQILIPAALRDYTGATRIEADGATLDALFDDLDRRYPGIRFRVVDEQGRLRPNIRIFVNGAGTRDLDHTLQPTDFVAVVLALSGGDQPSTGLVRELVIPAVVDVSQKSAAIRSGVGSIGRLLVHVAEKRSPRLKVRSGSMRA